MILFVNPPSRAGVYHGLGESVAAIEPPLWCRLLASYCEKKEIGTMILDADAEGYDAETAISKAIDIDAKLVVVVAHGQQPSASTQLMPAVIYFCQRFKAEKEDIPVLVVGGHPAALPEKTWEETGADWVCTGEGPTTISKLYEYLNDDTKSPLEFNRNVRGLYFVACAKSSAPAIMKTPSAENVWNLTEEMPGGMWNKLPMEKYRAHVWHALSNDGERQPYASIYTSLGCSFACSFCNIQNPFREGDLLKFGGKANSYRTWSAESVMREIETLVEKYNVQNLKIADEMFILKPGHVNAICDAIIERGYGERLNIWCYGRVDCTHEKFLEKLRRAGIRWIALGIEAASSDVRDGVEKADYGEEDIYRTCERIRAHGINLIANFIVGLPSDTCESMQQTFDMAMRIMPDFMNVYGCVTYPGSALWDRTPEERRNYNWDSFSHHGYEYEPAGNSRLSSADVVRYREDFFHCFYSSSEYQSHVLTKFGPRAAVEIAEMARVPLRRKLLGD